MSRFTVYADPAFATLTIAGDATATAEIVGKTTIRLTWDDLANILPAFVHVVYAPAETPDGYPAEQLLASGFPTVKTAVDPASATVDLKPDGIAKGAYAPKIVFEFAE